MNIYKHTAVSIAVSALILIILKKAQMSLACLLAGILIDVDHIFDYYMNHELGDKLQYLKRPREFLKFLSSRHPKQKPDYKLYKVLHSVELLILVSLLCILGLRGDVILGIIVGVTIHLLMDLLQLGHISAISIIYRAMNGFPRGIDVMKQRLSRFGRDVSRCQVCGVRTETILHKQNYWYTGFTNNRLDKMMILCQDCYDWIENEKD